MMYYRLRKLQLMEPQIGIPHLYFDAVESAQQAQETFTGKSKRPGIMSIGSNIT